MTNEHAAALGSLGGSAGTGESKRRGDSAYYSALRDRSSARGAVGAAVFAGKLTPPGKLPCTDCGHLGDDRRHEYDHYLGYAREHWLSVQPVCKPCHIKRTMSSEAWRNRPKSTGRPRLADGPKHKRINITLPPDVCDWLRQYGRGNLSGAIVALVRAEQTRR